MLLSGLGLASARAITRLAAKSNMQRRGAIGASAAATIQSATTRSYSASLQQLWLHGISRYIAWLYNFSKIL
jgi:hypothetical protein